jgi:hypothetical protein
MGYQNSMFPMAIYGCIDTATRRLLWLRIWVTNSDPKVIGRWYLEYPYETRVMPSFLRLNKGTETGVMAAMHAFLRQNHRDVDPCDTVLYGRSTSNQVSIIEINNLERVDLMHVAYVAVLQIHIIIKCGFISVFSS